MEIKPKIGITMRLETESKRFYLGCDYSEAVFQMGAVPFHLSLFPDERYIAAAINELDGILLPGSDSDIDPFLYGREPMPKLGAVVPEKDETDLLVLKIAEESSMPVLGICFGMQVLNVSRAGTLIQDIETEVENCLKHNQGIPRDRTSHILEIKKNSRISRLSESDRPKVNSHHHQAVEKVGRNLKVTARTKDGIIECIEDRREDRFVLGVQWHPELNWKIDKFSKNIFRDFVSASNKYSNQKGNKK